jgi:hypothetical protein
VSSRILKFTVALSVSLAFFSTFGCSGARADWRSDCLRLFDSPKTVRAELRSALDQTAQWSVLVHDLETETRPHSR